MLAGLMDLPPRSGARFVEHVVICTVQTAGSKFFQSSLDLDRPRMTYTRSTTGRHQRGSRGKLARSSTYTEERVGGWSTPLVLLGVGRDCSRSVSIQFLNVTVILTDGQRLDLGWIRVALLSSREVEIAVVSHG